VDSLEYRKPTPSQTPIGSVPFHVAQLRTSQAHGISTAHALRGMKATIAKAHDFKRWDEWLKTIDGANLRQTSGYRDALALFGQGSEILICEDGGELTCGALLGIRNTFPGLAPVLHTSGGLASRDPLNANLLARFLELILDYGRRNEASTVDVFLRVPQLVGASAAPEADALKSVLSEKGFHLREAFDTYYVSLRERSDEELLKAFGTNPRRHIRKGFREGLTVEASLAHEDFRDFEAAHNAMSRRKGLTRLPSGLLSTTIFRLAQSGQGKLFVARFQGKPRNYAFVSSVGRAIYLWGALSDWAREPGCPQTGQALHYQVMCSAKEWGSDFYDFGGTPGPIPDPSHPNYSVWKFKHEFNGIHVSFLGWWRYRLRPIRARLTDALRTGVALKRRTFGR